MVTEIAAGPCNKLFAFPIPLKRSFASKAETKLLYSANVSRYSGGRRDRLELYIRRDCIRAEFPDMFFVMAYRDRPMGAAPASVVKLKLYKSQRYLDSEVFRYRDWKDAIGDVYFPKTLIGADPPETCYLVIMRTPFNNCGK